MVNGTRKSNNVVENFFLTIGRNDIEGFKDIVLKSSGACVNWNVIGKECLNYLNLDDESREKDYPNGYLHSNHFSTSSDHSSDDRGVFDRTNAFHFILSRDSLTEEDKLQFLDILVQNGAKYGLSDKINDIDCDLNAPIHLAVLCGHSNIIKKLINWGADVNSCDGKSNTPCVLAANNDQHQALFTILGDLSSTKVDINKANFKGETLLKISASNAKLRDILGMYKARNNIFRVALPITAIIFFASMSAYFVIMSKSSYGLQVGKEIALAFTVTSAALMLSLVISLCILESKFSKLRNTPNEKTISEDTTNKQVDGEGITDNQVANKDNAPDKHVDTDGITDNHGTNKGDVANNQIDAGSITNNQDANNKGNTPDNQSNNIDTINQVPSSGLSATQYNAEDEAVSGIKK